MSQLETSIWAQLNKLQGKQFLLTGDFNQFGPVWDSWAGVPVHEEAFRNSSFYHHLAGGVRLTLREGRRSDMVLFDFYSSLIEGGDRFTQPLAKMLEAARAICTHQGPAPHNLVISHRRRILLNRQLNKTFLPADVTPRFIRCVPKKGQQCAAQNMFIWPGLTLLGCVQASKRSVRNNVLYRVVAIAEDTVTLQPVEGEAQAFELSISQTSEWLRLPFAQTFASCQGGEFTAPLRIHDTTNVHFTRRHLFVAMSRAKECANLAIA